MPVNLDTTTFRLQNANRFINDISASNNYYLFGGVYLNPNNSSTIPPIFENNSNSFSGVWTNMTFGKQITPNTVFNLINNVQWVSNTVYAMYDDIDPNLPSEQFFVITTEGSYNHIWKVLDNYFNSSSTVQPLVAQANTTPYYQTADGYRWKYMASISTTTASSFATSPYFPIVANSTVIAQAIPGSVEVFKITSNGAGYNNYVSGTFVATDISFNGSPVQFNISNNKVSTVNGYYTGCLLYITGGTGAGQFATISNFVSNTSGNIITIGNAIFPLPQNGSTYQIWPQVSLTGTGTQTVNCVAMGIVNSLAQNSISAIQVLQTGVGYSFISNSYIFSNAVVGVANNANFRAILSPPGGHGANPLAELYSNTVGISMSFANSENNTILTTNDYQQIGIVQAPLFSNVNITFTTTTGNFLKGESVYTIKPTQINANVTLVSGQTNVTCATANLLNQVVPNQYIYFTNQGGTSMQLAQVNTITNSSFMSIYPAALFSCTQVIMSSVNLTGNALVTNVNSSNNIYVTNCSGVSFITSAQVLGVQSGTWGSISTVIRNGTPKTFSTFQQLYKYNATQITGVFQQNEKLSQANNTGFLFNVSGTGSITLYIDNFSGTPFGNGIVTGVSSGATANITSGFIPELVVESGNMLYVENISPVTRANNQTETINLTLGF